MLRINSIALTQYKNYSTATFNFEGRITAICGSNGCGKTNLLDALYYLCFTKSYFSTADSAAAQFGSNGFRLQAAVEGGTGEACNVVCVYRGQGRKEITVNGVEYERLSQHIGRFPCVMVAPDDIELVTGGSAGRRRFMDVILSQTDPACLQHLINYNKILLQRNSLLKRFAESGRPDWQLLDVLDSQLLVPGGYIYRQRKTLTDKLLPLVQELYAALAGSSEIIGIRYVTQLDGTDFSALLQGSRQKDLVLQRTNTGIHKDELTITLNGQEFKSTASQGQRKSLLFALKLAEFELLRQRNGFAPLLLLDDIFEKLDGSRMHNLLQHVCIANSGQVFITDTHSNRLEQALRDAGAPFQLIQL